MAALLCFRLREAVLPEFLASGGHMQFSDCCPQSDFRPAFFFIISFMPPAAISFLSCQKRYERKERWMRGACCGTPALEPNLQAVTKHTMLTSPHRTTRRLFGKNQTCSSLRLSRCKQ